MKTSERLEEAFRGASKYKDDDGPTDFTSSEAGMKVTCNYSKEELNKLLDDMVVSANKIGNKNVLKDIEVMRSKLKKLNFTKG